MNITEHKSDILNEKYYLINHPTGLKIYVMPKENYSSAYAVFGTKYGSIDTRFKRSDKNEWTEVPEGIAHFLEHKLFERIWTPLHATQKQVRVQTLILHLTKPAIFFNAATILRTASRYFWILSKILISLPKLSKKNKA